MSPFAFVCTGVVVLKWWIDHTSQDDQPEESQYFDMFGSEIIILVTCYMRNWLVKVS